MLYEVAEFPAKSIWLANRDKAEDSNIAFKGNVGAC